MVYYSSFLSFLLLWGLIIINFINVIHLITLLLLVVASCCVYEMSSNDDDDYFCLELAFGLSGEWPSAQCATTRSQRRVTTAAAS